MDDELRLRWYEHLLSNINHPAALVGNDHKFVWCNIAYERLVGYAEAELKNKTWMSITVDDDVGGDLTAAQSIAHENRKEYTTAKHYRHKNGSEVPIVLTVWRFPISGDLIGFSVEAVPANTVAKLEKFHEEHMREIAAIVQRIENIETIHRVLNKASTIVFKWFPIIAGIIGAIIWLLQNLSFQ